MFKTCVLRAAVLTLGGAMAVAAIAAPAGAAVTTGWSFENATSTNTGTTPTFTTGGSGSNLNSDLGTVAGTATATHVSASTVWSNPAGNGSAKTLSSNNWAIGDYYQFTTSTTGVTGVQLLLDQTSSSTGPAGFKVAYSIDGGSNFTDLPGGAYTIDSSISFSSASEKTTTPPRYLFSGGGAFDNRSSLIIRLVDTLAPSATGGTSRIDNVQVGTGLTPEPSGLGLLSLGGLMLVRRRRPGFVRPVMVV